MLPVGKRQKILIKSVIRQIMQQFLLRLNLVFIRHINKILVTDQPMLFQFICETEYDSKAELEAVKRQKEVL